MSEKTCSKCGFVGEDCLFVKVGNICKKCKAAYDLQRRKDNPEKFQKWEEARRNYVGIRTCKCCNFVGDSSLFVKGENTCKNCRSYSLKEYRKNQAAKIAQAAAALNIRTCKKCNFIGDINLFGENKNICLNCIAFHIKNNKEKIKERSAKYRKNNKDKIRTMKREYENKKKKQDPMFKIMKENSNSIRKMLKSQGSCKDGRSAKTHFPFTCNQLKEHLESLFEPWMNWNNHGNYNSKTWNDNDSSTWTWQLDHIIPRSDLPYSSMEDENFKKCWSLSNLRPLSAKQNIIEGASKIRHKKGEIDG